MKRQMKVLILWADEHSANLGVRALAEGTAAIARGAFGDDVEVVMQDFKGLNSGVPITPKTLARAYALNSGPIVDLVRSCDVVIDSGAGDSFADIYGLKRLAAIVGLQRLAIRANVPLVFGPQTIGPFERRYTRLMATKSLKRASAVFARDHVSFATAERMSASGLRRATDVVFALPVPEIEPSDHRADVLFNVSGLLWGPNPHVDSRKYQIAVRKTLDDLLMSGRRVTLFPHVLDSQYADNDVPVSNQLATEYEGRLDLFIPDSLEQAREVIRTAQLVLASRMHAVLNALSQSTPAIPWAYSRKFAPLLADLGIDWSIDLRYADPDEICTLTQDLVARLANPDMQAAVSAVQEKASVTTQATIESLRLVVELEDGRRHVR